MEMNPDECMLASPDRPFGRVLNRFTIERVPGRLQSRQVH